MSLQFMTIKDQELQYNSERESSRVSERNFNVRMSGICRLWQANDTVVQSCCITIGYRFWQQESSVSNDYSQEQQHQELTLSGNRSPQGPATVVQKCFAWLAATGSGNMFHQVPATELYITASASRAYRFWQQEFSGSSYSSFRTQISQAYRFQHQCVSRIQYFKFLQISQAFFQAAEFRIRGQEAESYTATASQSTGSDDRTPEGSSNSSSEHQHQESTGSGNGSKQDPAALQVSEDLAGIFQIPQFRFRGQESGCYSIVSLHVLKTGHQKVPATVVYSRSITSLHTVRRPAVKFQIQIQMQVVATATVGFRRAHRHFRILFCQEFGEL